MTAPFAAALCGYRANGNPNTSDNHDKLSVEFGQALFAELGVASGATEPRDVGGVLERHTREHLASLRPDMTVRTSTPVYHFEQYAHLRVFRDFTQRYQEVITDDTDWERLRSLTDEPEIRDALTRAESARRRELANEELIMQLTAEMPEESLLRVDLTVSDANTPPRLLAAISAKWTLRTDRAQDCVSQGSKLVAQRRGIMPHYSVLTMEPRPAMLRLIAYGSGAVDCVYHVALPELRRATAALEARRSKQVWMPRVSLERMVAQGRLRDYDDLVAQIERLS